LLFPFSPFHLNQEVVWHYEAGVSARNYFSPRNEKWLWLVKDREHYIFDLDSIRDPNVKYPNQKKNGKLRVNPLGKNPGDVWIIPKVTTGQDMDGRRASAERTSHPAQFPERVIERIVLASSAENSVVLDPFGGSGTTSAVAERLGRWSIYFDVNDRYLQIARDRVAGKPKREIQDPRVLPLLRPLEAAGNE
jgi:adenine-specific DNA-methyltransferase